MLSSVLDAKHKPATKSDSQRGNLLYRATQVVAALSERRPPISDRRYGEMRITPVALYSRRQRLSPR